jgi:predicted RND superfamily exporter protein
MWTTLGRWILRYRYVLLALLLASTVYLGWQGSKVKLSYEFAKAIPTDHPKYLAYQQFRRQFGDDGNLIVIGVQKKDFFDPAFFNRYIALFRELKRQPAVEEMLALPSAVNLVRSDTSERLQAVPVFDTLAATPAAIDSAARVFLGLPFYRGLLYNPETGAWLMGVKLNSARINSPERSALVANLVAAVDRFSADTRTEVHLSGLPYIRTITSDRIQREMRLFLVGSVLLSALILLLFFRSLSATLLSLAVVIIGVVWSVGVLQLSGYKITILTALIPPLVVVIGIPNCIYFLNKFHSTFRETGDKEGAILAMIGKMGIVTLFCNIAAAIGFAVFALTESAILKEFGVVAGINIMALFFISLILIPAALKALPSPKARHMRYLDNARLQRWLQRLERWALHHRRAIYLGSGLLLALAIAGIFRLQSVGFIVDDLPKKDRIYTDLKFFEENFKGVMPLEIVVDTRKKYGVTRNLSNLVKIDSLMQYLSAKPYFGKPLSITEGLKFARQAFFEGDPASFAMPGENDLIALRPYLSMGSAGAGNTFNRLVTSFIDSNRQQARISVSMKDIGSARLPLVLDSIEKRTVELFDTSRYTVRLTGTSVTFLEGSRFIINGLKDSVFWAFVLIAGCMLYLFRSGRILLCSLLPNVLPLIITAGVMGWAGVPLKPSTVLVFSVALGIAIDITIRFLVNYRQQLDGLGGSVAQTVSETIHSTGLSILYTAFVLIAGFVIFCFSGFGGTRALGWLTSLTLVTATLANLILLPALLISLQKKPAEKK